MLQMMVFAVSRDRRAIAAQIHQVMPIGVSAIQGKSAVVWSPRNSSCIGIITAPYRRRQISAHKSTIAVLSETRKSNILLAVCMFPFFTRF
jgi:hypothetical protein